MRRPNSVVLVTIGALIAWRIDAYAMYLSFSDVTGVTAKYSH